MNEPDSFAKIAERMNRLVANPGPVSDVEFKTAQAVRDLAVLLRDQDEDARQAIEEYRKGRDAQ